MNTQKSAYWVALALFAVALHSEYQRGAFPSLQRAANSASATLCRLTTKAEQTVAMAKLIVGRPTRSTDGLLAGLDALQLMDASGSRKTELKLRVKKPRIELKLFGRKFVSRFAIAFATRFVLRRRSRVPRLNWSVLSSEGLGCSANRMFTSAPPWIGR